MRAFKPTTRRRFLQTILLLGIVFQFRPARAFSMVVEASGESDPLAVALASLFTCHESTKRIGLEYLRCRPLEANEDVLVDLLCSGWPERHAEFARAGLEKRRRLLAMQQRQDFEHGRVVMLQGWIMSETEGRLCALALLQRIRW